MIHRIGRAVHTEIRLHPIGAWSRHDSIITVFLKSDRGRLSVGLKRLAMSVLRLVGGWCRSQGVFDILEHVETIRLVMHFTCISKLVERVIRCIIGSTDYHFLLILIIFLILS